MADELPGDGLRGVGLGFAVRGLDATGDEHPGHHAEGAGEKRGATAELVDVDDGGDGHDDVDDVLDGGGEEGVVDAGALHHVHDVVHCGAG